MANASKFELTYSASMFDPTHHGFYQLDLSYQSLHFFARRPDINTKEERLAYLTVFLTQDGDFVTVWNGLFDAGISTSIFKEKITAPLPKDWNFQEQYNILLFRGYIEDDELGAKILAALRLKQFSDQQLVVNEGKLICELLPPVGD